MNNDKILQSLNYLEEKHQKNFDNIYDARVNRQLHKDDKQHLIDLLKDYKETLKETEKQIANLLYSIKNENLKYKTFSHYSQEENTEINLFCSIDLQLNKASFYNNGKKFTRKIKQLESYSIGIIYNGLLFTCVNYK